MRLEASNHPFIWAIKARELSPEFETWLSEGFEERTKGKSLIIRGWAISAGAPMITWPNFYNQFLNQKLIVEVLRIGVAVGIRARDQREVPELVKREVIEEVVGRLMDGGPEAEQRRKRAGEIGVKAREAMEVGRSSYKNMTRLIRDFSSQRTNAHVEEVA